MPKRASGLEVNAERHLKSPDDMARLFASHPQAIARGLEIVEACRFSLDELKYEYPDEPVPPGKTPQEHLADLTWRGRASAVIRSTNIPPAFPKMSSRRLHDELAIIEKLDFARYFLTVHDIVAYARECGILCQGRGSAANSAVCYCLGITEVDPNKTQLLFARFISQARGEPPDIDVDFEHERREEVIQYIYRRYGRDRAAICATVIHYRSRRAIGEVGKVLGLTPDITAALSKTVWGSHGGEIVDDQIRQAGLDPAQSRHPPGGRRSPARSPASRAISPSMSAASCSPANASTIPCPSAMPPWTIAPSSNGTRTISTRSGS